MTEASSTLGVGGILRSEPAPIVRRLVFATKEAARPEHRDLFDAMSRVNLAHVVMLHERRLIAPEVAAALAGYLLQIREGGPESVPVRAEAGDLYPQIEAAATKRLGHEVAGYLQLGRSRGDVIPSAMRLKLRMKSVRLLAAQLPLRRTLLELAERHVATAMPAYTHYQQSQVMSLGHFLGRFAAWFEKDFARMWQCVRRHDYSPLGSANGVGTSVPVDRELTSRLLAHRGPVPSAGDAVYAWDYMIEPVSHAALFCSNASRLAGNFILWHTREFGMLQLSDAFATASTYLPQKRNPEPLETVKFFAEAVAGHLAAVYQFARNEDWPHSLINHGFEAINGSFDMATSAAELMEEMLRDLQVDKVRMAELAEGGFVTASEVANTIVQRCNIPFRTAHEIVGFAVRKAIDRDEQQVLPADLRLAARHFLGSDLAMSDTDLAAAADSRLFLGRLTSRGSAEPQQTLSLIQGWRDALARDENELNAMLQGQAEADTELLRRAQAITSLQEKSA
jgi:argininosuccinate lyase